MRYLPYVLLLLISTCVLAGEKKELHLTGNPSIDLFSRNTFTPGKMDFVDTSVASTTETGMPSEKSPLKAAAMSLVIPGAGEVYDGSYLKAGIFFAIDVTALALYFQYNNKGDNQTTFFQQYADAHYSPIRYAEWTQTYAGTLNPNVHGSDFNVIRSSGSTTPPFSELDWQQLNLLEDSIESGGYTNGYTHTLPYYSQQQYYELIGKYFQFSTGWDDANMNPPGTVSGDLTNGTGYRSKEALYYADQRALANHYYDIAYTWVSIAVVNHVVSAFDAYFTAKHFNNALHAQVDIQMRSTPYGAMPIPGARFTYNF